MQRRTLISRPETNPDTPYDRIPDPGDFERDGMDFLRGKDIEAIAALLIEHYESQFAHLRHFRIGYLWKRSGGSKHGHPKLGQTQRTAGLVRFYGDVDFVIWLAADHLRAYGPMDEPATHWTVEAVVYHELMHVGATDDKAPAMRGHDFEGFAKEVTEYGSWDESAEVMRIAFEQLELTL